MSIFDDNILDHPLDSELAKDFHNYIEDFCNKEFKIYKVENGIIYLDTTWNKHAVIKKPLPEYFHMDSSWERALTVIKYSYGNITSQKDIDKIQGHIIEVQPKISNCTLKTMRSVTFKDSFKNINLYSDMGVRIHVYIYILNSIEDLQQIKSHKNKLSCIIPLDLYTNVKDLLCSNVNIYKNLMATLYYQNNITEIISPSGSTIYLENILHGKDQIKK